MKNISLEKAFLKGWKIYRVLFHDDDQIMVAARKANLQGLSVYSIDLVQGEKINFKRNLGTGLFGHENSLSGIWDFLKHDHHDLKEIEEIKNY